jgi:GTPase SAR1 family protein
MADVPGINDEPFRIIVRSLRAMRAGDRGTSIVVTGEPGSGKTHLLGRLRNRLEQDERDGKGETVYVYVRCQASASTLWRHVQQALASDLLKPMTAGVSRLDSILRHHPERLEKVRHLSLRRVLERLRDGQQFHVASAWLRGELVPDADLQALGVAVENDEEDRGREYESRRLIEAILRFTAPTPTVLCFDQVEALETYRGDEAGFHAMGQLVAWLINEFEHVLAISCVVNDYEAIFEKLPNKADRDRWLQYKSTLRPIEWDHALELVKVRLDAAPALAAARKARPDDALWPLDPADLKPLFEKTGLCLPRTLIQTCKQLFDALVGDDEPRPKRTREEFLQEEYESRLAQARAAVQKQGGDKTLDECLPWLLETCRLAPLGQGGERSQYASRAYRGPGGDTALVFCYQRGNRLTNRLRKIERHWKAGTLRLKILRDLSIKPGRVAEAILTGLKNRGAKEVYPLPEALAALQAIRDLRATALSGELTEDGIPVSEQEVTAWALNNLPPQVEQLREELVSETADEEDPRVSKLSELVNERKIIAADAAARELSLSVDEVSDLARRHPLRFGFLAGPPVVVFEAVEGPGAEHPRA